MNKDTTEQPLTNYELKMQNWVIEQHANCPNFVRVKEWSLANGYTLHSDVSYNGFLDIRKIICETEDPHDGHRLNLQIFCDESIAGKDKYHSFDQYDMEIDFEFHSIMKPLKYRYKAVHGKGASKGSRDLEELLAAVLEREAFLKLEHEQYLKNNPTTEWKLTDPDNFQYGRLVRGVPEFKEFDRVKLDKIFKKLKEAPQDKVNAYLESDFDNPFPWIQQKVLLSMYKEDEIEKIVSSYYKNLAEVKETYGKDWEFIVAECIFEQESGLY